MYWSPGLTNAWDLHQDITEKGQKRIDIILENSSPRSTMNHVPSQIKKLKEKNTHQKCNSRRRWTKTKIKRTDLVKINHLKYLSRNQISR